MGITRNFLYNSILTISTYIFPLIVFPYVSRVLGVSNIGICNFVDSIINYFILFSMMGMSVIGVREIAKSQDKEALNKTFSELFVLNAITTFLILIVFFIALYTIPQLYAYKELMYIGGIKIIFNLFLIEWFYRGIENFQYITVRSIGVKILYVILIFIFVREEPDYIIYYGLTVGVIVLNSIINWIYRKGFVAFSLKNLSLRNYSKPFFINGIYMLLTSMYTSFNVAFLGFVSDEKQVGYYTTAIKLYTIFLGIFSAFTHVMMPRMSILVAEKRITEVKEYMDKSFDVLFAFSLPLICMSVSLASVIIQIIAGKGYEGAIIPMQIIMPLILIVGLAQIFIIQVLIPAGRDNVVLLNSIVGAMVGIVLNILIVRQLGGVGSAIVVLFAEFIVTFLAAFWCKKYFDLIIPGKKLLKNLLFSIPYFFIGYFSKSFFSNVIVICFFAFILAASYFFFSQIYILKNVLVKRLLLNIKDKLLSKF